MCSCVSPGWSCRTAVSPTRVGNPASPGTATPSNTQPTRQSHSHVRARALEDKSQSPLVSSSQLLSSEEEDTWRSS